MGKILRSLIVQFPRSVFTVLNINDDNNHQNYETYDAVDHVVWKLGYVNVAELLL